MDSATGQSDDSASKNQLGAAQKEDGGNVMKYMRQLERKYEKLKKVNEKVKAIIKKTSSKLKKFKKSVQVSENIANQIEYYFSDENLKSDIFMIRQLKQSKNHYVNLKMVANFKKVKKLSKNIKVVKKAINTFSEKLVLNESQTMIKRVVPFAIGDEFPLWIDSAVLFSRTGERTIYDIFQSASSIGTILHFQIFNADETRKAKQFIEALKLDTNYEVKEENIKHNLYSTLNRCNGDSILVVYRDIGTAKKAVDMLSEVNINWRFGMKVCGFVKPLLKPSTTTLPAKSSGNADKININANSVVHTVLSEKIENNSVGKRNNRLKGRGSLAALLGEACSVNEGGKVQSRRKLFQNTKSGSLLDIVGLSGDNLSAPIKISQGPDGTRGFNSGYQKNRGARKQFSADAIEWVPN